MADDTQHTATSELQTRQSRRSWPARLMRMLCWGTLGLVVLVFLAWCTGRVLADRWHWSQWLLWIPSLALLPVVFMGGSMAVLLTRPDRRRRAIVGWIIIGGTIVAYVVGVEHRTFVPRPPAFDQSVRILHWNASGTNAFAGDPSWKPIVQADADINIITNPLGLQGNDHLRDWLGPDGIVRRPQNFAVITRIPILEQRPLIRVDDIAVVLLVFDTNATLGRPLTLFAIDLPSNPKLSRIAIAQRVRRLLTEVDAPEPDVVIGDFNMTRGSAALDAMFPECEPAYQNVGHGYTATYPRAWPLYHLDQALTGQSISAYDYEVVNPDIGRHQLQILTVVSGGQ